MSAPDFRKMAEDHANSVEQRGDPTWLSDTRENAYLAGVNAALEAAARQIEQMRKAWEAASTKEVDDIGSIPNKRRFLGRVDAANELKGAIRSLKVTTP